MKTRTITGRFILLLIAAFLAILPTAADATIQGITGTNFALIARADTISTGDGDSMWMWGYASGGGRMQYPGPTFIVNQGANITIRLRNQLPVPVSIVIPGQTVTASGGVQGLLTREVPASPTPGTTGPTTVIYRFTASQPGTYMYYSGTRSDLQVEMGLIGTIIVRPTGFSATTTCPASATPSTSCRKAYNDPSTAYHREYLFVLSEADPLIHQQVAFANNNAALINQVDMTRRRATDWFINGRNFPDTMADAGVAWLPTQPYNCMPMMLPSEKVLIRMVSAGRDFHPLHTHGQNHLVVARDARLLSTNPTRVSPPPTPDLAVSDYSTTSVPGETVDAIWGPWTGAKLGWDIYGTAAINPHTCTPGADGFDPVTHEYCADHYKPIPVQLPSQSVISIGVVGSGMWSGTPYLGQMSSLPPSITGQNPMAGYSYMWHSHSERELTTNNIFPGGMASMALVVPVGTPIP